MRNTKINWAPALEIVRNGKNMTSPKSRLTAVDWKEILTMLRTARVHAKNLRLVSLIDHAQLLDNLADVAEKYLEVMKDGTK